MYLREATDFGRDGIHVGEFSAGFSRYKGRACFDRGLYFILELISRAFFKNCEVVIFDEPLYFKLIVIEV